MPQKNNDKHSWDIAKKGQPYIDAAYYDDLVSVYKVVVSARILQLRIQKNMSQKQLAQYLSVTPQAVTMMEKGKRIPSFEVLCKLADLFQISLDYLVGRSDNPEINR